jgi:hypothetical protein
LHGVLLACSLREPIAIVAAFLLLSRCQTSVLDYSSPSTRHGCVHPSDCCGHARCCGIFWRRHRGLDQPTARVAFDRSRGKRVHCIHTATVCGCERRAGADGPPRCIRYNVARCRRPLLCMLVDSKLFQGPTAARVFCLSEPQSLMQRLPGPLCMIVCSRGHAVTCHS